jgi:hypothetical protein
LLLFAKFVYAADSASRQNAKPIRGIQFVVQFSYPSIPKNVTELIPMNVPAWVTSDIDADKIKATWMG